MMNLVKKDMLFSFLAFFKLGVLRREKCVAFDSVWCVSRYSATIYRGHKGVGHLNSLSKWEETSRAQARVISKEIPDIPKSISQWRRISTDCVAKTIA